MLYEDRLARADLMGTGPKIRWASGAAEEPARPEGCIQRPVLWGVDQLTE